MNCVALKCADDHLSAGAQRIETIVASATPAPIGPALSRLPIALGVIAGGQTWTELHSPEPRPGSLVIAVAVALIALGQLPPMQAERRRARCWRPASSHVHG